MPSGAVLHREEKTGFDLQVYFDISKMDEEQQIVEGYASRPGPDSQGEEIASGAWTPEVLAEYMKFPTLRAQHDKTHVAGTVLSLEPRKQGLYARAHVIDPIDWLKVKGKAYPGFSIRGKVAKRDPKNKKKITEMESLEEISLVDKPAQKESLIEVIKLDDLKEVAPVGFKSGADVIEKSLWNLRDLTQVLASLKSVYDTSVAEEIYEQDEDSTLPDGLAQALNLIGTLVVDMTNEETGELLESVMPTQAQKDATKKANELLKAAGLPEIKDDTVTKAKVSKGVFNAALKDSVEEHKDAISAHKEAISSHADLKDEADKLDEGEDHAPLMKKMQECSKAAFKGESAEKISKLSDMVKDLRGQVDARVVQKSQEATTAKEDKFQAVLAGVLEIVKEQGETIQKLADGQVKPPKGAVMAIEKGKEVADATVTAKAGTKEDVIQKMKDDKISTKDKLKLLLTSPAFKTTTQTFGF